MHFLRIDGSIAVFERNGELIHAEQRRKRRVIHNHILAYVNGIRSVDRPTDKNIIGFGGIARHFGLRSLFDDLRIVRFTVRNKLNVVFVGNVRNENGICRNAVFAYVRHNAVDFPAVENFICRA